MQFKRLLNLENWAKHLDASVVLLAHRPGDSPIESTNSAARYRRLFWLKTLGSAESNANAISETFSSSKVRFLICPKIEPFIEL